MKLFIVFLCLAFVCMIQSAPSPSASLRQQVAHDDDVAEDEVPIIEENSEEDETTTTTTTTRRPRSKPSRNREITPPRREWKTPRTPSVRTTTVSDEEIDQYEGDFRHFKNIRALIKKVIEDLKKYVRTITAQDIIKAIQRLFSKQNDDDD